MLVFICRRAERKDKNMIDLMLSRRSVRKFTDEKLSDYEKDMLIKAALAAPSSMAKYPVELILTEDRAIIDELITCKTFGTSAMKTAPLVITVIADAQLSDVWVEDASIAATYMTVEAEKLGLGMNWIQMRNRSGKETDSPAEIRRVLGIPEKYGVLAIMAVGHKAEFPAPYDETHFNFSKIHAEKF